MESQPQLLDVDFSSLMNSQPEVLKRRTKQFAVRIVNLFKALPITEESRVVGKQLLRSGTTVAANYRAACRSRSKAEFIAKVGVVVEEADETVFWLELLIEVGILKAARIEGLIKEANELLAMQPRKEQRALIGRSDNSMIR